MNAYMSKHFSAVRHQAPDMTLDEFWDFIKAYVHVQFPGQYNDFRRDYNRKDDKMVPDGGYGGNFYNHNACYVQPNHNGGELITITLIRKDKSVQEIGWIKGAEDSAMNWALCGVVSEMINRLYYTREIPVIVDFAEALPGSSDSLKGQTICLHHNDSSLDVLMGDKILKSYDFSDQGGSHVKNQVAEYITDWQRLAGKMEMHVRAIREPNREESQSMSM